MSAPMWSPSARSRRAIAFAAVVLATGGLVLFKSPGGALGSGLGQDVLLADGKASVRFTGEGARGLVSLSHSRTLSGQETRVFAEIRLVADERSRGTARAP